jgi:hypothetical protein
MMFQEIPPSFDAMTLYGDRTMQRGGNHASESRYTTARMTVCLVALASSGASRQTANCTHTYTGGDPTRRFAKSSQTAVALCRVTLAGRAATGAG